MNPVLKINNLKKYYETKGLITKAINGISFEVENKEFLAIMGLVVQGNRLF